VNGKPVPTAKDRWRWPVNVYGYDRSRWLSGVEREALDHAVRDMDSNRKGYVHRALPKLTRLIRPVYDVFDLIGTGKELRRRAKNALLREMHWRGRPYWDWSKEEWCRTLNGETVPMMEHNLTYKFFRSQLTAVAYLLCGFDDIDALPKLRPKGLAEKVFGREAVDAACESLAGELIGWGWGGTKLEQNLPAAISHAFLANRSPRLEDLTRETLQAVHDRVPKYLRSCLVATSRVLAARKIIPAPLPGAQKATYFRGIKTGFVDDCPREWAEWCDRWRSLSPLAPKTRSGMHGLLLQAGRWLARTHPGIVSPEQWDREIAAEYVAAVDRLTVGEWVDAQRIPKERVGKPMTAYSKAGHLGAMTSFFRACHEWGLLKRRFDPGRALRVPRSISSALVRDPRVISDEVWTKLLWAGMNLSEGDLDAPAAPGCPKRRLYPIEMVRAMAMVLLFAGLRANEIRRLRVGCVRRQHDEIAVEGEEATLPKDSVCWLDVPVQKTGHAFTKPVEPLLGEAVRVWEAVRPRQPPVVDEKTAETVDLLFSYRGDRIGQNYLNTTLIRLLCDKAGVPRADERGKITVHRMRATIATQLHNAEEPMGLADLQEWLGHSSPATTQHYAKVMPTKMAKSYRDAEYFKRNVRRIDVMIDQDAVRSGAPKDGEPWKFYDLGHGYCSYDFFDQCQHRMACARCSFYVPKDSTKAQILEGKANLSRMREDIPLRDEEVAAIEDGLELYDRLIERLADVPTPAGLSPRELGTFVPLGEKPNRRDSPPGR